MTTTAAKSTQAPVTMWETFEGATYGYDAAGARIIEIDAATRATAWSNASNVRGWAAFDARHQLVAVGTANGLRESKKAALAALRADASGKPDNEPDAAPVERVAPPKGRTVLVNDTYPSRTFIGRTGKVESSARGDDGQVYVTVDFGNHQWPFLVTELDLV